MNIRIQEFKFYLIKIKAKYPPTNMSKYLKEIDILADYEAPIHRINFEGKTKYKSALGGFCTMLIVVAFLLVLISESDEVIKKKYPFV